LIAVIDRVCLRETNEEEHAGANEASGYHRAHWAGLPGLLGLQV
jgi:hypothetical protein